MKLVEKGDISYLKKIQAQRLRVISEQSFKVLDFAKNYPNDSTIEVLLLALNKKIQEWGDTYQAVCQKLKTLFISEKKKVLEERKRSKREPTAYIETYDQIKSISGLNLRTMNFFVKSLNQFVKYMKKEKCLTLDPQNAIINDSVSFTPEDSKLRFLGLKTDQVDSYLNQKHHNAINFYQSLALTKEQETKKIEEQKDSIQVYQEYISLKSLLKVRDNSGQLHSTIIFLENYFDEMKQKMQNLNVKCQTLEEENTKLIHLNQKALEKIEEDLKQATEFSNILNTKLGPTEAEISKKMELNYHDIIQNLEYHNKKYSEDKDQMKMEIIGLENKIQEFEHQRNLARRKRCEQFTQTAFEEGVQIEHVRVFSRLFKSIEASSVQGVLQRKEWVSGIINHSLVLMFKKQMENLETKRSPTSMRTFIIEYFLQRFGNAAAARQFMMDFIVSLKEYHLSCDRFRIFSEFCGLGGVISSGLYQKLKMKKSRLDSVKKYYMESYKGVQDYLQICAVYDSFKKKEVDHQTPLLPFDIGSDSDLISTRIAQYILSYFISKEDLTTSEIAKIEDQFESQMENDLYSRFQRKGGSKLKSLREHENMINFDVLTSFIINRNIKNLLQTIQEFLTSLTMSSGGVRGDSKISYDDLIDTCTRMFPKKGEGWVMSLFRDLIDVPMKKSNSLNKMIDFSLDRMIEKDQVSVRLILFNSKEFFVDCFHSENEIILRNLAIVDAEKQLQELQKQRVSKYEKSHLQVYYDSMVSWRKKVNKEKIEVENDKEIEKQEIEVTKVKDQIIMDNISSLCVFQETYSILKREILRAEKSNESIGHYHADIKQFLMNYPSINAISEYRHIDSYEVKVFHNILENMWSKMTSLIGQLYYAFT